MSKNKYMARKALIEKNKKPQKYPTRKRNRCFIKNCGRARGLVAYKKFKLCRFDFRKKVCKGEITGVRPISW